MSPASLGDAHWYPLLKCAATTSGHEFPPTTQHLCPGCILSRCKQALNSCVEHVGPHGCLRNTSGYPRLTCFAFFFTPPISKALLDPEFPKICPGTSHGTLKPMKNKLPCSSISPRNIRLCLTLPLLWLLLDFHISGFSYLGDQILMETTQGRMKSFWLTL